MEYLDFEQPIKDLVDQLQNCTSMGEQSGIDIKLTYKQIELKIEETKRDIYGNLTPWQRVQLSRHPNRPYTLDYCELISDDDSFMELHGDRNFADDKAMVAGLAKIDGVSFMIIGQQKGKNTKERQYRRFGMPNPEGYRKALRMMRLAEKFNIPILTLLDTSGAYPGLEAEERGQGEAIARNILEMFSIKVPIITVVIGEGASGGAIGIGVGNKVFMMENSWYSVISPESCASILWRSWEYKEKAAESLKLTAEDMLKLGIIDGVIKEPLGGAHYDKERAASFLRKKVVDTYKELSKLKEEDLIKQREDKYIGIGVFKG